MGAIGSSANNSFAESFNKALNEKPYRILLCSQPSMDALDMNCR